MEGSVEREQFFKSYALRNYKMKIATGFREITTKTTVSGLQKARTSQSYNIYTGMDNTAPQQRQRVGVATKTRHSHSDHRLKWHRDVRDCLYTSCK